MNAEFRESLYDLYEQGGLEIYLAGTRGQKRELVINLETSALNPESGDIVRFRAVNRFDPDDEFDEWVKPPRPFSAEAERVIGMTNERLAHCRTMQNALTAFLDFIDGAELVGDRLDFDLDFLNAAGRRYKS